MHIHSDVLTLSALCADQPVRPTITTTQNGTALTGPVVFRVNQTVSIWCKAENTVRRLLQAHNWQYANGTKVPKVDKGKTSDHDVYRKRFAGRIKNYTPTWWEVLHFRRIQASYAGMYTCVANYNGIFKNRSVEVIVTGECMDSVAIICKQRELHGTFHY